MTLLIPFHPTSFHRTCESSSIHGIILRGIFPKQAIQKPCDIQNALFASVYDQKANKTPENLPKCLINQHLSKKEKKNPDPSSMIVVSNTNTQRKPVSSSVYLSKSSINLLPLTRPLTALLSVREMLLLNLMLS